MAFMRTNLVTMYIIHWGFQDVEIRLPAWHRDYFYCTAKFVYEILQHQMILQYDKNWEYLCDLVVMVDVV